MLSSRSIGWQMGLLSTFAFGWMGYLVHNAPRGMSAEGMLFIRSLFMSLILAPLAWKHSPSPFSAKSRILWIRSATGIGTILCSFWNLTQISVTHAMLFSNFTPLLVLLIARWHLGEKLSRVESFGVFLSVCGVLLPQVFGSGLLQYQWTHIAVGVLGCLLLAASSTSLRQATLSHTVPVIIFWMSTFGLLLTSVLLTAKGTWQTQWQLVPQSWYLLGAISIISTLAQIARTYSYAYMSAGKASALGLLTLGWGFAFEAILDGYRLQWIEGLSILVTLIGIALSQRELNLRKTKP